ncbi:MAG: hypothetical protein ACRDT4_18715 [Micromonosporaceae bacterium]
MRTATSHPRPLHTANGHRSDRSKPDGPGGDGAPRLAFYTAASHADDPNPHASVMAQYADQQAGYGPGQIRAVFFDITGTPRRRHAVTAITRDGGMADLLREALSPTRRFDYLITPGLKLLDRHGIPVLDVLRLLNRAEVAYLFRSRDLADEIAYLIAAELLDGDR